MRNRRIFKIRHFARWARKAGLTDEALCEAVREMAAGLIEADLGRGLVKKRIGLPGRGKRGGARTIVATSRGARWFFLLGFAKNEDEDIGQKEYVQAAELARDLLRLSDLGLSRPPWQNYLVEVRCDREDETR